VTLLPDVEVERRIVSAFVVAQKRAVPSQSGALLRLGRALRAQDRRSYAVSHSQASAQHGNAADLPYHVRERSERCNATGPFRGADCLGWLRSWHGYLLYPRPACVLRRGGARGAPPARGKSWLKPAAGYIARATNYLAASATDFPVRADSRAAVRISVTIMLFSRDDNPEGLRRPRATAIK
jgi:hypothetical protein